MENTNLQESQVELLYEAQKISRAGGEPRVVDEASIDAVREALSAPLSEIMSPEALEKMPISALAAAVTPADEDEGSPLLDSLSQQPLTGGEGDDVDEEPEPEGVEALSHDERSELETLVESHDRMSSRTPKYASEVRQEALEMVGGDDFGELKAELGV